MNKASEHKIDVWDDSWSQWTVEEDLETCADDDLLPILLKYLPKQGKVLEAGCGFGRWIIYLKNRGYTNIIGIDNSPVALSKAKLFDPTLPLQMGDIRQLPFPDGYFKAYLSFGVIEHFIEGPAEALKEGYRVLEARGLLLVTVPCENVLRRIKKRLRPVKKLFKKAPSAPLPFFEYHYSRRYMEELLKREKFEILFIRPVNHPFGLWYDLPFFRSKDRKYKINRTGRLISRILRSLSPWFAPHMILCVGRAKK